MILTLKITPITHTLMKTPINLIRMIDLVRILINKAMMMKMKMNLVKIIKHKKNKCCKKNSFFRNLINQII